MVDNITISIELKDSTFEESIPLASAPQNIVTSYCYDSIIRTNPFQHNKGNTKNKKHNH